MGKLSNFIDQMNQKPFIIELMKGGSEIYAVGGVVRDLVLNKQNKDIDLVIRNTPIDNLVGMLEKFGRVDLVGKSFGVLKFVDSDGLDYDIALPRKEKPTGEGGHKAFEIQSDENLPIESDLTRRDAKMNSMAINLNTKKFIDPLGGLNDIENKRISATNPEAFNDDPLRMVRMVSFASRFRFVIELNTLNEIRQNVGKLNEVSPDRILEELNKIVNKFGDKQYGVELLVETGLYQALFGKNIEPSRIESRDWEAVRDLGEYFFLMTFGVIQNPAEFFKVNMTGDNDGEAEIQALTIAFDADLQNQQMSNVEARSIAHNMFSVSPMSLESQILPQKIEVACKELLSGRYPKNTKELAVNGNDIMATGLKGKPVGDMQKSLLIRVYADQLKNDREELLQAMRPNQSAGGLNEVEYFTKEQIKEYFGGDILNERKESKYMDAKKSLQASKSISKEMKELIAKYMTGGSTYHEGGRVFGLMKPKEFTEKTPKSSGVSLGADKNGFFCYTHRARCHSHPTPGDIPIKKINFIETTG